MRGAVGLGEDHCGRHRHDLGKLCACFGQHLLDIATSLGFEVAGERLAVVIDMPPWPAI
jgi:hypothetical protein